MTARILFGAALLAATMTGGIANAEEVRIAVGCPAAPACSDWVWAEDLANELRGSGLEARVFVGGSLGKDPELVDQMEQGLLQFGVTSNVMVAEIDRRIHGFNAPYMFDDMPHMFRALEETDILGKIDANMQAQGIRIAGLLGLGGTNGIFNARHPVTSPADLSALRIRAIDANQSKLIERWGASSVVIDMPEFMSGLQQGVVDGYVNPPVVPLIFQHTDYLKFYTASGAGTPYRTALMSNEWYNGLSDEDRAKVDAGIAAANGKNREWTAAAAASELDQLRAKGITVTILTPEARADFVTRSRAAWPALMPEAAIPDFVAAAEATRK